MLEKVSSRGARSLAARRLKDQCGTPAVATGSSAPGPAAADEMFPALARTGSVADVVNQSGHNEPAGSSWGKQRPEKGGGGLYHHSNSWQCLGLLMCQTLWQVCYMHTLSKILTQIP